MALLARLILVPVMLIVYLLAIGLAPVLTMKKEVYQLKDIKDWGFSGPSRDSMPEALKGVFYFDGNQAPTECDGPESKMCRCATGVTATTRAVSFSTLLGTDECALQNWQAPTRNRAGSARR